MPGSHLLLVFSALVAGPAPCPVPADLAPGGDVAYVEPKSGGADLAAPAYRPPDKIAVPLRLYLPPPAPFGSQAELGAAVVDLKTAAVALGDPPDGGGGRAAPPAQVPWAASGVPLATAERGARRAPGAPLQPSDCR